MTNEYQKEREKRLAEARRLAQQSAQAVGDRLRQKENERKIAMSDQRNIMDDPVIQQIIGEAIQDGQLRGRAAQLAEFEAEATRLAKNNVPRHSAQMLNLRSKYVAMNFDPAVLDQKIEQALAARSVR